MGYSKIRYLESTVHIYEVNQVTHKIVLEFGKLGVLEPLSKLAIGAEAKINCGYFGGTGNNLIENYGTWSNKWTTVCYNDNGDQLVKFYDPETMNISTFNGITKENTLVFGASFTLIENNKISIRNFEPFSHWSQRNPRTIFAQKKNRNLLFIVVEGRRTNERGMTAKEEAKLCIYLNARCAVNLDGGGSSEMIVNNKIMNRVSDGFERKIGSCLAIYDK
jgi:exopolysaccharide biosynthesis protein